VAQFELGKVLKTNFGAPIKIIKYLAGGGQGDVYEVEYEGEKKALKWYKKDAPDVSLLQFTLPNVCKLKMRIPELVLPEAFVTECDDGWGYLMELLSIGDKFYSLEDYLPHVTVIQKHKLPKVSFSSSAAKIDACISLVNVIRTLHNHGYTYVDLSGKNLYIDPCNGDIRLTDCDSVFTSGTEIRTVGTSGYAPPEVVDKHWWANEPMTGRIKRNGKYGIVCNPNSTRFSLAVILFQILCGYHPLEVPSFWTIPILTNDWFKKIYGLDAKFVFDDWDDNSGEFAFSRDLESRRVPDYVKDAFDDLKSRWSILPKELKDLFVIAFSQSSIKDPNRRPRETEWLKVLTNYRSACAMCICGSEVLVNKGANAVCDKCGQQIDVHQLIIGSNVPLPVARGSRIYQCQIRFCDAKEALYPFALVVSKPNDVNFVGLRNMTRCKWDVVTPKGDLQIVESMEVVPFAKGTIIKCFGTNIELS